MHNRSQSRPGRFVVGMLLLSVCLGACGQTSDVDPHQVQKNVLKMAILTEYQQEILPAGDIPGHLTDAQHDDLRARIIDEYSKWYTGTLLTSQLTDMLAWADRIAVEPTPRTVTARMDALSFSSLSDHGARADAIGSYKMYHVNTSVADEAGHEAMAGGLVTLTFQAELVSDGGGWRVSTYQERLVDFVEDPSARAGQQYMPTSGPAATMPIASGLVPQGPTKP